MKDRSNDIGGSGSDRRTVLRVGALVTGTMMLVGTMLTGAAAQDGDREEHHSTVRWAHDDDRRRSVGSVLADRDCDEGRIVLLKKQRRGHDRVLGRDSSDRHNNWQIRHGRLKGRYYAVVLKKAFNKSDGTRVVCSWDRSPIEKY